jgi:hypothetical protein
VSASPVQLTNEGPLTYIPPGAVPLESGRRFQILRTELPNRAADEVSQIP